MNDSVADPHDSPAPPAGPDPGQEPGTTSSPAPASPPAFEPAAPRPLGVERVPTGDPAADELLTRLADADHLPADGHQEVYEDVHRGLRDALTALDARPAPQGPPAPPATSHAYDHRS
ncbi:hypothetical protein OG349_28235 [Streptomyces sp. NBC_01317]|uniref:hypothetical protein n=1 Tax=Streptomyces sp. NBC_01317 TaxID=2903822 RepID=UPI002E13DFA9|nr:hypothetical protein OG349_28235 [Streptomyces sp. NBC_01317]